MSEPIHIISLGAGVQSSTMALMAAAGEITPMPVAAIFADTGDEPDSVYAWLEYLKPLLPFPVHVVSRGRISTDSLKIRVSKKSGKRYLKTLIPAFTKQPNGSVGLLGRKCTRNYKVDMIIREARRIAKVKRGEKSVKVVQWIGISLDEAHRMKDSHIKWSQNRWPLVDMEISRTDCLKWMKLRGFKEPPRSACVYCPFHSDFEWQRMKIYEPNEFQKAVKFELDLQNAASNQEALTGVPFLNRRCVTIDKIDFSENLPGYVQTSLFGNECEGMCGV